MIIIGYQGIGKSTLANKDVRYIDLESNNFFIDGVRQDNWYKIYCNIATHLSQQGKRVFVSSHEVVRSELKDSKEDVVVVYPSLDLKDEWLGKLDLRWQNTSSVKDYKAFMNAKEMFEENIKDLQNSDFIKVEIKDINYNLKELLGE